MIRLPARIFLVVALCSLPAAGGSANLFGGFPVPCSLFAAASAAAGAFQIDWYTIDCGGTMNSTDGQPDGFKLSGTIGQPDASSFSQPMTGGGFALVSGFWPIAAPPAGVPAATLTAAVTRKANPSGPGGFCDLPLIPGVQSEPRQGSITEIRLTFDMPPGGPGANPVTIEQATCAAPAYAPYSGASSVSPSVAGNDLVLTFTPGLENARTYKLSVSSEVTSMAGQFVELRGLLGDVSGDGLVRALDRSQVVSVWTGPGGFSCSTDLNLDGQTKAADRSIVVSAWTSTENCAP